MPALKTPAEKIPLAARKDVRDHYEAKKPEYEATMKDILGETWTIEMNPNLVYEYASDDHKNRLGTVFSWYMKPFLQNLKNFASSFGADGVQELNTVCSKHQLLFGPQEKTSFSYGGLTVADGILHLVFADGKLGVNVDDVTRDVAKALQDAPADGASAYNLVARNAVKADWDAKLEELRSKIVAQTGMSNVKLNGNFEANAAELAKSPDKKGWEKQLGKFTRQYFEGLEYQLRRHKFKDDDLQQEALQEAVSSDEICFRILPKWDDGKSRYNEVKIENGILYIQTITDKWGVNVDEAATKITSIL